MHISGINVIKVEMLGEERQARLIDTAGFTIKYIKIKTRFLQTLRSPTNDADKLPHKPCQGLSCDWSSHVQQLTMDWYQWIW